MDQQGSEHGTTRQGLSARFQRLSRTKKMLLVWLAALDLILATATAIYAFAPDGSAASTVAAPPNVQATDAPPDGGLPLIAGNFEQIGKASQAELALRQYEGAITGTYTQTTCAGGKLRTVQRVITGQALADGTVRLTFSAPDLPHSLTIVYQFATQPVGFVLSWRDGLGRAQAQRWQPEATPLVPLVCG